MPLEMKYFILKPRAKYRDDRFATASQDALQTFADMIETTDRRLAEELRTWAGQETAAQARMSEDPDEKNLESYRLALVNKQREIIRLRRYQRAWQLATENVERNASQGSEGYLDESDLRVIRTTCEIPEDDL